MVNRVCEKGVRNRPLTEEQKANNREKSRVRSRVEHILGVYGKFDECNVYSMYWYQTSYSGYRVDESDI